MSKDYYKTLGVEKSASKDEIKKAFRKLAHEYHPDKATGNEAKFKEINEAYGVLSDDTKRAQYDQFGSGAFNGGAGYGAGGFGGGQGFGGFDFSGFGGQGFGGFGNGESVEFDLGDIFSSVFGGGMGGSSRGRGGSGRGRQAKGPDISVDLEISFKDSIFGAEKDFSLHRTAECEHCKGTRAEPKGGVSGATASAGEFESCKTCQGSGQVVENRRSIFGTFQSARVCDDCYGTGKIPKEKCKECKGKGVKNKKDSVTVIVPAGIEAGEMLRVSGRGEAITGGKAGDLYIKIHIRQEADFRNLNLRKDGANLHMDAEIKLSDALLGGEMTLKTLEGPLIVAIPQGISHGEILRVQGKGVPYGHGSENPKTSLSSSTRRGDLMIHIKINIPKKLGKDARKLVEEMREQGL